MLLLLDFGGPGGSRDGVEDRGTRAREEGRRSAVVIVRMRKMAGAVDLMLGRSALLSEGIYSREY